MDTLVFYEWETCRLCAGMHDKSNMTYLFAENDIGGALLEKIRKYTHFEVNVDDDLPKFVCIICISHIDHWHNFLQLCVRAQKNLISTVKKKQNTADRIQKTAPSHTVGINSNIVSHPAVDVVDNASNQKKASQNKHQLVLLDVKSGVTEKLKTCLMPDSTVGENVSITAGITEITTKGARRNYCIARWCNNSTRCNSSLSFFRVPKNRNRAVKWLKNAEREDLLHLELNVLYSKFLCSDHFTGDMFTNSTRSRLLWNAVPTVFPRPHYADKIKQIQANTAVQKLAMELLHSSVPTRILPKPESKSTSSVTASADTVCQTTRKCETRKEPMDFAQVELSSSENNNSISELLNSAPLKTEDINGKSSSENIVIPTHTQPQSSFLTDSMCSFQESHEPVFPCRYCGEMFLVKSSLILHQTTYHPEHSVGCEQCGKVNYTSKSEFMGHLCEHTEVQVKEV